MDPRSSLKVYPRRDNVYKSKKSLDFDFIRLQGKEVSLNSCYVCTTGGRNAKIADPITSLDLSVASKCKKFGRRGLKPDRSEAICTTYVLSEPTLPMFD